MSSLRSLGFNLRPTLKSLLGNEGWIRYLGLYPVSSIAELMGFTPWRALHSGTESSDAQPKFESERLSGLKLVERRVHRIACA